MAFIKSKHIKVFPTSLRGQVTTEGEGGTTSILFDPASRLTTEYNLTSYGILSSYHNSYCISYIGSIIKFRLAGYLFEINMVSDYLGSDNSVIYAEILLKSDLESENDNTTDIKPILQPIGEDSNTALDVGSGTDKDDYEFYGLKLVYNEEDLTPGRKSLKILEYVKYFANPPQYRWQIPSSSILKLRATEIGFKDTGLSIEGQFQTADMRVTDVLTAKDVSITNSLNGISIPVSQGLKNSSLTIGDDTDLLMGDESTLSIGNDAFLTMENNTNLLMESASTLSLSDDARLLVHDGAHLEIKDNAKLTVDNGANIQLLSNIYIEGPLQISSNGNNILTINNNLTISPDATVTLKGSGSGGSTLALPNGSLSLTKPSVGRLLYGSDAQTYNNLSAGDAGQVLISQGNNTAPSWTSFANNVRVGTATRLHKDTKIWGKSFSESGNTITGEINISGQISNTHNIVSATPNEYTVGTTGNKYLHVYSQYFTGTTYFIDSDERLKENIEKFNYKKSILDLEVKTFKYKETQKESIGIIAQDLYKLYPELVNIDDKGFLSIEESKLVYLLLEEVRTLKEEVNRLKEN